MFLHNVEEINGWEWQLNYSTIRPSTSRMILIYPNVSGYITAKVRRSNECGCGNWLSKNFNVISSSRGRFLRD